MGSMVDGYIIQRDSADWDERFWMDNPAVGIEGFGEERRARLFITKEDADLICKKINYKYGIIVTSVRRDDIFPKN